MLKWLEDIIISHHYRLWDIDILMLYSNIVHAWRFKNDLPLLLTWMYHIFSTHSFAVKWVNVEHESFVLFRKTWFGIHLLKRRSSVQWLTSVNLEKLIAVICLTSNSKFVKLKVFQLAIWTTTLFSPSRFKITTRCHVSNQVTYKGCCFR